MNKVHTSVELTIASLKGLHAFLGMEWHHLAHLCPSTHLPHAQPTHYVVCHILSSVGEQGDVHLHLKQTEDNCPCTVNDGDWRGRHKDACYDCSKQPLRLVGRHVTHVKHRTLAHHSPESAVVKGVVPCGPLPYTLPASTVTV